MPYYKVVKREGDKLVSIYAVGDWQVEYKEGEWSEAPDDSYLYVYNKSSGSLPEWYGSRELWEVEIDHVAPMQPRAMNVEKRLQRKWADFWGGKHWRWGYSTCSRSVWVKSVKLVRRIGTWDEYYDGQFRI